MCKGQLIDRPVNLALADRTPNPMYPGRNDVSVVSATTPDTSVLRAITFVGDTSISNGTNVPDSPTDSAGP